MTQELYNITFLDAQGEEHTWVVMEDITLSVYEIKNRFLQGEYMDESDTYSEDEFKNFAVVEIITSVPR